MKINIEGLNKVKLLKALYDAAKPGNKTDESIVVDLEYLTKAFKNRQVNVINGKAIKCDLGRLKLMSGVYDSYNGDYAALNAVEALKAKYEKLELSDGMTIRQTIDYLKSLNRDDVVVDFNGHTIYSDNIEREEPIFMHIAGRTEEKLIAEGRVNRYVVGYVKPSKKKDLEAIEKSFAKEKARIDEKEKRNRDKEAIANDRDFQVGDLVKYFKRELMPVKQASKNYKYLYRIIAMDATDGGKSALVVYKEIFGKYKVHIKPLEEFLAEVDKEENPRIKQKYVFEKCVMKNLNTENKYSNNRGNRNDKGKGKKDFRGKQSSGCYRKNQSWNDSKAFQKRNTNRGAVRERS